jgi:hypothetical protein
MWKEPGLRAAVIGGLVVWLLTFAIFPPLAKLLQSVLAFLSVTVFAPLIDRLYGNAALGPRELAAVLMFGLAIGLLVGTFVGTWMILMKPKWLLTLAEKKSKIPQQTLLVLLPLATLLSLFQLIVSFSDFQMNTSFQQRLTVLAPVLSGLEEKRVRAMWASMRTRHDYEIINTELEGYAKARGITLPTLLWR